ncbi:MAG TPA: hypothetical protein VMD04_03705, partial [Candidatus Margulisiibacteriota bacterium]|nr:hypothetical protein [Candidatus Margulisiibacteriota bacterium]
MPLFLLSNILLILNALFLCRRFCSFNDAAGAILTFFIFCLGQIIFVELVLGIAGFLSPANILFLLFIILIINLVYFSKAKADLSIHREFWDEVLGNKLILLTGSVFLGFFLPQLWNTFINPPLRSDALIYHLVFPVNWLVNGNLNNPLIAFGEGLPAAPTLSITYYPFNAELLFFWLLFPFRSAFLANIAQAPFYFLGIIAIYGILRKFSLPRDISILTGLLWVLIPNCFKHMKEGAYIDIICAALFFVCVYFLLLLKERPTLRNKLLFGISCGIFLGLKSINIFWLLVLSP